MFNYQFKIAQDALKSVMTEDWAWVKRDSQYDAVRLPWMPFQAADFLAILAECVAEASGDIFLDVGSGIGTKIELAECIFGMDAFGIEYDPEMRGYAMDKSRYTILGDALTAEGDHYQEADIIWLYRPFRDQFSQARLEHRIFELMKPGAIVAGGAWENQPSGFEIVIDDWETGHRGAWKKPLNWQSVTLEVRPEAIGRSAA
jgi:hypothetical protein